MNVLTIDVCLFIIIVVNTLLNFKTCSVFGHCEIEITESLKEKVYNNLKYLIQKGCNTFYLGGFGMFDNLCYEIVTKLKETFPQVKRVFCLFDERHIMRSKRPKWLKEREYDDFVYFDLKFNWWYKRIYYRNCEIVDRSDIIIFYAEKRENSGAYKILEYANRKHKLIINLIEKKDG